MKDQIVLSKKEIGEAIRDFIKKKKGIEALPCVLETSLALPEEVVFECKPRPVDELGQEWCIFADMD